MTIKRQRRDSRACRIVKKNLSPYGTIYRFIYKLYCKDPEVKRSVYDRLIISRMQWASAKAYDRRMQRRARAHSWSMRFGLALPLAKVSSARKRNTIQNLRSKTARNRNFITALLSVPWESLAPKVTLLSTRAFLKWWGTRVRWKSSATALCN